MSDNDWQARYRQADEEWGSDFERNAEAEYIGRPVTREEALQISREILEKAEAERAENRADEARNGMSYVSLSDYDDIVVEAERLRAEVATLRAQLAAAHTVTEEMVERACAAFIGRPDWREAALTIFTEAWDRDMRAALEAVLEVKP
jgi:hypothetical protein